MSTYRFLRRYHGPLQAVIFDWAGTMIDYGSRAPVAAVMESFRRSELPISEAQARGPMGMAKRDHLRAVLESADVQERWQALHGRPSEDRDIDAIYQKFLPLQRELLAAHADLIPGCLETINFCRSLGMRIGTSTGYTQELMDVLVPIAREKGLVPDAIVCTNDVPAGRPAPWMCFENARRLGVFPMEAVVKIDDTTVGIEAGLNAGMWTVGISRAGNLVGLSEHDLNLLPPEEQEKRVFAASETLYRCGAHFVVDSVADLPAIITQINEVLKAGSQP